MGVRVGRQVAARGWAKREIELEDRVERLVCAVEDLQGQRSAALEIALSLSPDVVQRVRLLQVLERR